MFTKHFLFTITKYLSQKYKFKTLDVVFNDVVLMKIKIYKRFYNLINSFLKGLSLMDTRLIVIAAPLLVAASWALFNIGRLAIQQIQRLTR